MPEKPSLIVACPHDGGRLLVSILSIEEGRQDAIARALERIAGSAEASSISPGETISVDGEVLVAMAPESPKAAAFLRHSARLLVQRDIREDVDVLVVDLAEDLVRTGLADAKDIPAAEDAFWIIPA